MQQIAGLVYLLRLAEHLLRGRSQQAEEESELIHPSNDPSERRELRWLLRSLHHYCRRQKAGSRQALPGWLRNLDRQLRWQPSLVLLN